MQLLLSGASGFVGTSLRGYLGSEHNIKTVGRKSSDFNWDALDDSSGQVYIHLAAMAQDDKNGDLESYREVNVGLTQKMFESFLKSEARLFIYFSSVKAVIDETDELLDEGLKPHPKTAYGISKWEAEKFLLSQELPSGKKLVILRPTMIHGPGNSGSLLQLYKFVAKGIPYPFAAYDNQRSFLAIENLCKAVQEIIHCEDFNGGIYHICDDEFLSTNRLIELIGEVTGRKVKLWKVPRFAFNALAGLGDTLKLPFNSHILGKLTADYKVSNQKLKKALGWEKMPVRAEEGIRRTVEAFRED